MTTGRINQVANPSSARGEDPPAELQRSAAARLGPRHVDRHGEQSPVGSDVVGRGPGPLSATRP